MKKNLLKTLVLITILFCTTETHAQVTIPDPNFVTWLNNYGFASCMNGNMMDTTCSAVVNANYLYCANENISDLTGIQYFDNLIHLIELG